MYIDTPLGITGGQSYLIVLAICGCSIGILSFFTLVSIIRTLRAEGIHQFPPEDLIEVEREGRMGASDVAMPNVNAALVRNIAEKAQTRGPLIQLRRGSERIAKVDVQRPGLKTGLRASVSAALRLKPESRPSVNVRPEARPGVNAALARSIAEKAQRARTLSGKAQNAQQGSKLEVIPGIMVKTRTLSNLEDAKAIIQRKMKEQEDRTRSRSDVEIADAMVMTREKVEEKLERESFSGIQMPNEKMEETRYADEAAVSTHFPQATAKAGMGEAERGPPLNSTDELMRRAAILDVKTLNTEFVELRESLVLLKNKLKDIQEKRKRPLTPMRQAA